MNNSRIFDRSAVRCLVWGLALITVLNACGASAIANQSSAAEEIDALLANRPITLDNWPIWREFYVRRFYEIFFYDDFNRVDNEIILVISQIAQANGNQLPAGWSDDAVAWNVWARFLFANPDPNSQSQTIEAARHALKLDDTARMSSMILAVALVRNVEPLSEQKKRLSNDDRKKLSEAEELLNLVEKDVPKAKLNYWRGEIALRMGDRQNARQYLQQAIGDFPGQPAFVVAYLQQYLADPTAPGPFTESTSGFAAEFPNDAMIRALHAIALLRDQRFIEATQEYSEARKLDADIDRYIGVGGVKRLEEAKSMTARLVEGDKLIKSGAVLRGLNKLREELRQDPENIVAARLIVRQFCKEGRESRMPSSSRDLREFTEECAELCKQFPHDPELHVAHAALLFQRKHLIESEQALQRAEEAGAQLDQLIDPDFVKAIHEGAEIDRRQAKIQWILIEVLAGFACWLTFMYLAGVALAFAIPRTPNLTPFDGEPSRISRGPLELFYLVVLSLSLLVFYLTVPFVVAGLLVITLGLFAALLCLRIIHEGILSRGLFAVSGVVRAAFFGLKRDVQGIETAERDHPRLHEILRIVADEVGTSPVDRVFLIPSSSIGVYDEGVGPFGLFRRQRVIVIGISTLHDLTTTEFKSILAHEYGHFSNQDTYYSKFIAQVTVTLDYSLAVMKAAAGPMNHLNPFYWFYWLYLHAYRLLSAGFSRTREFMADRCAISLYGREPFVSGLAKVAVNGAWFDASVLKNVYREFNSGRVFANVFAEIRGLRDLPEVAEQQAQIRDEILKRPGRLFDTHPTYAERVSIADFDSEVNRSMDSNPAIELLENAEEIEQELTRVFTQSVSDMLAQGFRIPAANT